VSALIAAPQAGVSETAKIANKINRINVFTSENFRLCC
jgi:hypothetical protein